MQQKLCIALQRTGRLAEGCLLLFKKCGIEIKVTKNQLLTQDDELGINFIFARDDDIPGFITNGICDMGIIGQNLLDECNSENHQIQPIEVIMSLGFAKCRLSIAGPKNVLYTSVNDIENKTIATSYPNTLKRFLEDNKIKAKVVTMHGSVELATQIGIADLICDLVSSGTTLKENGLQEWLSIKHSEAILIRKNTPLNASKQQLLNRLMLRINGVIHAHQNKYIMLHIDRTKLPFLTEILPGSESPTIINLQGRTDKVAVHVVSLEAVFWDTIEKLKAVGASSILVLPIEKMLM